MHTQKCVYVYVCMCVCERELKRVTQVKNCAQKWPFSKENLQLAVSTHQRVPRNDLIPHIFQNLWLL